jgi:GNAT superfamily N-acetyltransferase
MTLHPFRIWRSGPWHNLTENDSMIRRPVSRTDFEEVHALFAKMGAWDAEWCAKLGVPAEDAIASYYGQTVDDIISEFATPDAGLWLAVLEGRIVGCAGYSRDGVTATVHKLYVDPVGRGKGLGDALIRAVLDSARDSGATTARLVTASFMTSAIALYRRNGFTDAQPFEYGDTDALRALNVYLERPL